MPATLALSVVVLPALALITPGWPGRAVARLVRSRSAVKQDGPGPVAKDATAGVATFFDAGLVRRLISLSIMRYVNIVARSFFVVLAGHCPISGAAAVLANPMVYLSMLLGITPANLRLMEWTWIGSLRALGVTSSVAADFAITQRILLFGATVMVASGCLLFLPARAGAAR